MAVILIIALLVIVSIVLSGNADRAYNQKVLEDDKKHLDYIERHNITRTSEFIYNDTINRHYFWFIADSQKQKVYVATDETGDFFNPINYSEIINAKIHIDTSTHGEITRAIVGGAIAGTAGAIVGAQTAKSKVNSYKLVIERNNMRLPTYEFVLINKTEAFDSITYQKASEFAENVLSVLKVIIYNNQKSN